MDNGLYARGTWQSFTWSKYPGLLTWHLIEILHTSQKLIAAVKIPTTIMNVEHISSLLEEAQKNLVATATA